MKFKFYILLYCVFSQFFVYATPKESSNITAYQGIVNYVVDGDTVHIKDQHGYRHKVRLSYIDAPEKNQKYGQESTSLLKEMLLNKKVTFEIQGKDQYKRELAVIYLDNGKNINLETIRKGMAWYYPQKKRNQSIETIIYQQEEKYARSQKIGLWKNRNPIPPWKFRKNIKSKHEKTAHQ